MSLQSLLMPDGDLRVIRCDIADKLIACADSDSALLYLYIVRKGNDFNEQNAKRELNFDNSRYDRSVFTLTNLIIQQQAIHQTENPKKRKPDYTASELKLARETDHKFSAICDAAEDTLGMPITDAYVRSLYTIYDEMGLPAEVIIELLSYLKREKTTIKRRDIEREAYRWTDMGIYTIEKAQKYLATKDAEKPILDGIYKALNIVGREPSNIEQNFASICVEHGFNPEAVSLAVSRTERITGAFSLNYVRKIMLSWHEKGVHTVSEITAIEPEIDKKPQNVNVQEPKTEKLEQWEVDWLERMEKRKERRMERRKQRESENK